MTREQLILELSGKASNLQKTLENKEAIKKIRTPQLLKLLATINSIEICSR